MTRTVLSHMSAVEVEMLVHWSLWYHHKLVCAAYGGIDRQQIYRARAVLATARQPLSAPHPRS